jgi:hypothetical protein
MEKKYFFAVRCKCGHVGRRKYIEMTFPIKAGSKKEAAEIGRWRGGVKHHHKEAVEEVVEITIDTFRELHAKLDTDPYWKGASSHHVELIERIKVLDETEPPYRPMDEVGYRRAKIAQTEKEIFQELLREFGGTAV